MPRAQAKVLDVRTLSHVYVAYSEARQACKVGTTTRPVRERFKDASTWLDDLELVCALPGGAVQERAVQAELAARGLNVSGEWFTVDPSDALCAVASACIGLDVRAVALRFDAAPDLILCAGERVQLAGAEDWDYWRAALPASA